MKEMHRSRLLILTFIAILTGCADPAGRIAAPNTISAAVTPDDAAGSADRERAALAEIGRIVAMSLGDQATRHELKKHFRAAPFRAHKLELARYARSAEGKAVIRKQGDKTPTDALLTLLDQVRPLEFYMPVRKHRESWVGDEEVLVAVQLEEEDPIVAFNSRGERIQLDLLVPPEQPTLSIVPVETRFDRPMPALGSRNIGDMNGRSIGTLVAVGLKTSNVTCADCVSEDPGETGGAVDGGGGGGTVPSGLYLEFSRILDVHEPWTKDEPEIEVHIHGPTDQKNPKLGVDLSCSGAQAFDPRKAFDQNGGFWEGRVMLFSAEEIERYDSQFSEGFHVLFWEDDDTECVLKLDNDSLLEFLKSSSQAFGTAAVKIVRPTAPWYVVAGTFLATFFHNAGDWLRTNDDFVGAAVATDASGYDAMYPNNTHVIMQGTELNGRATIVSR